MSIVRGSYNTFWAPGLVVEFCRAMSSDPRSHSSYTYETVRRGDPFELEERWIVDSKGETFREYIYKEIVSDHDS